jgi:D-serine deaminase-like pyridoxal phosphate-dependent protein
MDTLSSVETPSVIVDYNRLLKNIKDMKEIAKKHRKNLHVHTKVC